MSTRGGAVGDGAKTRGPIGRRLTAVVYPDRITEAQSSAAPGARGGVEGYLPAVAGRATARPTLRCIQCDLRRERRASSAGRPEQHGEDDGDDQRAQEREGRDGRPQ